MDAGEIDTFTARVARFTDKGLGLEDAERLADALTRRDCDGDERRLCIECAHLHGRGPWHCANWQRAGLSGVEVSRDLALMPQRCDGFAGAVQ